MRVNQYTVHRLHQRFAQFVDFGQRFVIGFIQVAIHIRVGDHFHGVVDAVKDDNGIGNHHDHVRIADNVFFDHRHARLKNGNHIVAEKADGPTDETRQCRIADGLIAAHKLFEYVERIGVAYFAMGIVFSNFCHRAPGTEDSARIAADEGVAADMFAAFDAFEHPGM